MSGKRGSNPRPSAWEADALPLSYSRTLIRPIPCIAIRIRTMQNYKKSVYGTTKRHNFV